jgi:hypothetical protein
MFFPQVLAEGGQFRNPMEAVGVNPSSDFCQGFGLQAVEALAAQAPFGDETGAL